MKEKMFLLIGLIAAIIIIGLLFGGKYLPAIKDDFSGVQLPSAPKKLQPSNVDTKIINVEDEWTTNFTHDASIIKVDDWYYAFSTDYMVGAPPTPGIQIRKSKDLIHWEFSGRVFDQMSLNASTWTNGGSTYWAPAIEQMNNTYYLYYSVSQVGKRNSYIGLATSNSIDGPWTDKGAVIKTKEGDGKTVNAIDPDIIVDKEGKPWMVYGSYFGGIFIAEVDKNTGKLVNPDEEGELIAQRKDMNYGIEGPEILYNPQTDYYYLTVSYGWLEDTYNVRAARSKDITGPYVDYNHKEMIDLSDESFNTGNKLVGSYLFGKDKGWLGTGHNGLLSDNGDYYIFHNARAGEDIYWSHLHVRKMVWSDDGWPIVSPERFTGETEQKIKDANIIGKWERIILYRHDDSIPSPKLVELLPGGNIKGGKGNSHWELTGKNTLKLAIYDPKAAHGGYWQYKVKVLPAWDWENWNGTLIFTGMDQDGTVIWGKKIINK